MTAFNLHIHYMDLRERLEKFYTKDRLKFTGFLGIFMTFVGFIGKLYNLFEIHYAKLVMFKIWFATTTIRIPKPSSKIVTTM